MRHIEDVLREVLLAYGYQEVGLPCLESTELFERLVGGATDLVEKEMYTFTDRNGESLSLRPEGTAGCVRYALQNGLIYNQTRRFWYEGAMFRHERPQKGRYRQFHQIGVECFGMAGPDIDAELLLMTHRIWQQLGLSSQLTLELNTLGSAEARHSYRKALVDYLQPLADQLDEDSHRRLATNPLRILDSKVPETQRLLEAAPVLPDFLDEESAADFATLQGYLDEASVPYVINPKIVRGLDYYNKTVFEWTTKALGAQGTVCGGGRYDSLVELLGGKPTPGVGFAMGTDRLALMLTDSYEHRPDADIYIVSQGSDARTKALGVAESLRAQLANKSVVLHCGESKFKAQMKRADASGASLAVIIGEQELATGKASVKCLRREGEQVQVGLSSLADYCASHL